MENVFEVAAMKMVFEAADMEILPRLMIWKMSLRLPM